MRTALPYHRPGQRIGLLGGSFDPPHAGHLHLSREALRCFALDQVWWLVSPGNPLKDRGPAPLERRLRVARALVGDPRIRVTDLETQLGTRYTADTVKALRCAAPQSRFVWLMGADNLVQFDQWRDWREIMETVPVGVLARPGSRMAARRSRAARIYARARLPERSAALLATWATPVWCFVNMPMRPHSSSAIRAQGTWP